MWPIRFAIPFSIKSGFLMNSEYLIRIHLQWHLFLKKQLKMCTIECTSYFQVTSGQSRCKLTIVISGLCSKATNILWHDSKSIFRRFRHLGLCLFIYWLSGLSKIMHTFHLLSYGFIKEYNVSNLVLLKTFQIYQDIVILMKNWPNATSIDWASKMY